MSRRIQTGYRRHLHSRRFRSLLSALLSVQTRYRGRRARCLYAAKLSAHKAAIAREEARLKAEAEAKAKADEEARLAALERLSQEERIQEEARQKEEARMKEEARLREEARLAQVQREREEARVLALAREKEEAEAKARADALEKERQERAPTVVPTARSTAAEDSDLIRELRQAAAAAAAIAEAATAALMSIHNTLHTEANSAENPKSKAVTQGRSSSAEEVAGFEAKLVENEALIEGRSKQIQELQAIVKGQVTKISENSSDIAKLKESNLACSEKIKLLEGLRASDSSEERALLRQISRKIDAQTGRIAELEVAASSALKAQEALRGANIELLKEVQASNLKLFENTKEIALTKQKVQNLESTTHEQENKIMHAVKEGMVSMRLESSLGQPGSTSEESQAKIAHIESLRSESLVKINELNNMRESQEDAAGELAKAAWAAEYDQFASKISELYLKLVAQHGILTQQEGTIAKLESLRSSQNNTLTEQAAMIANLRAVSKTLDENLREATSGKGKDGHSAKVKQEDARPRANGSLRKSFIRFMSGTKPKE